MWQTLDTVLRASWQQLGTELSATLPNALASALIFLVGGLVGVIAGRLTGWLLARAKIDRGAARLGILGPLSRAGVSSLATLVGRVVKWTIIGIALIPALYSLDARVASDLVGRSLLYLPHLAVAVVLLWIGFMLSRFLARGVLIAAVNARMRAARLLAGATRSAVMLVAVAVAFEHIGIGRATVLTAFAILFGGVTLAAALAVGLGSQEIVRQWLNAHVDARAEAKDDDPISHM
jgi:Mechanosensitive ion channel, conserved TM helix